VIAMSAAVFAAMADALAADPSIGKKLGGVLRFVLSADGKQVAYTIDGKASAVRSGKDGKADCTVTMAEDNFLALVNGKLSPTAAYMSGKLKLSGKAGLAQKFAPIAAAAQKKLKATPPPAPSPAPTCNPAPAPAASPLANGAKGPSGFASDAVFAGIAATMRANPAVLKKVNGSFLFHVTAGPGGATTTWLVNAKEGEGAVQAATDAAAADCTITISDANLVALASGKLKAPSAYMSGKLKLSGKMALAQKLGALMNTAPKSKL